MTESEAKLTELEGSLFQLPEAASKEDLRREARRRKRSSQVVVAVALLIAIAALYLSGRSMIAISDASARQSLNTASIEALEEANKKLEARGLTPIPVPQPGGEIDINALAQAAAALALADIRSDPSFRGPRGADGLPGSSCLPDIPGCSGPTGAPGKDGKDGSAGAPCDPSNPLCRGPEGKDGADGAAGEDGAMGIPGTPGQGFAPNDPMYFELSGTVCELVVNLTNPVQQRRIVVSSVLCTPS